MPYLDLPEQGVSFWYRLYGQSDTLADKDAAIDPLKPTVLFVHPTFLGLNFFESVFRDRQMRDNLNIVLLDLRLHGRTRSEVDARHDLFVTAADLAHFMAELDVPCAHVVGVHTTGSMAALRLALLFPHRVQSLQMISVPDMVEKDSKMKVFREIVTAWVTPADPDEWREAVDSVLDYFFNEQLTPAEYERFFGIFIRRWSPARAAMISEVFRYYGARTDIPAECLAKLAMPIRIYHGTEDRAYDDAASILLRDQLTGARDGAELHYIQGAPFLLTWTHAKEINPIMLEYVQRWNTTAAVAKAPGCEFAAALHKMVEITGDRVYLTRSTRDPMSFSAISPIAREEGAALYSSLYRLQPTQFCLVGGNDPEVWEFRPESDRRHSQLWESNETSRIKSPMLQLYFNISTETVTTLVDTPRTPDIPIIEGMQVFKLDTIEAQQSQSTAVIS
ncbi:uncharacterized protein L969DRAFT_601776 [Mixia osmundae IAM 14324]|uniref:uncharacterized protein n=1 Tax=Mixia osmundae (strain CBS 9802 / IAM 14324 / JCM 22182 / KY 12970) TaxID=764103 RepID=UPI0004A546CE|nr:uncharacterized protein L969DRAFT_601776 [Mixia osmundae IAM 14324]KEI37783.1 hypothetical protein L969DRAFT_601776 [Mixia osmundae IAM 14324]